MNGKARKGPLNVFCVFMAFVTAFLLTGCGGTGKEKTAETDAPVRQEMIWQGEGFGEIMSATEGSPVYLVDYQQGIEELPDLSGEDINDIHSLYLGFYQDKIYLLTICSKFEWIEREDGSTIPSISPKKYFLCTYNLNTGERESREIPLDYYPESGAVTNDGKLLFFKETSYEKSTLNEQIF